MTLHDPLDDILGQPSKVKILRLLVIRRGEMSGREIARAIGMSHVNSHISLKDLTAQGILIGRNVGRALLYSVDPCHVLAPPLRDLFDFEGNLQALLARTIRKRLGKSPLSIILFGSQSRDQARGDSDIDFLVVSRSEIPEKVRERVARDVLETFGSQGAPLFLTRKAFRSRYLGKDALITGITQSGKVIFGATISELL